MPAGDVILLAVVTIGSVVFGNFAQDVASWLVCIHSELFKVGENCSNDAQVEAVMIGAFISTMIAVIGAAAAAQKGKLTSTAASLAIVGALAGALFTLLKAAAKNASYPQPHLLGKPLYIYAVCVLLFALSFMLLPKTTEPIRTGNDRALHPDRSGSAGWCAIRIYRAGDRRTLAGGMARLRQS